MITLIASGVRGIRDLTEGKEYEASEDIEEGIFSDRPYVSVIDDAGKRMSCHAHRFLVKYEGVDYNDWNSLRDFIEANREVHIGLCTHIDSLRYETRDLVIEILRGVRTDKRKPIKDK